MPNASPTSRQEQGKLDLPRIPQAHLRAAVQELAFAQDGRLLATASQDGSVRLWDPASLGERAANEWEVGKLRGVAFAPDGRTVATVGEKSRVVIWDVDAGMLAWSGRGTRPWPRPVRC